ncbi:TPA: ABC transporter ATP-binding protein [Candidatus Poribacteria bacterium]|nr:ABC transporter ATP-binding protein [Candidatus Poribacteria bacterium]
MLLQAKDITKQLGLRLILRKVNLSVENGESVAIFGPNGAGKSTFMNIIATLMKPTSGWLTINGEDVLKNPLPCRSKIGLVAHEPNAYLELTPNENLKFFGRLYGVENLDEKIEALLDYVGLTPFAHEPIQIFSSGMVKRFMITKALIHEPNILLLDEPFTGLDANAKQLILKLIADERMKGTGIIFITHDIQLGYEAASRFTFLFRGRLEEVGFKKEITVTDLQQQYGRKLTG